MKLISEHMSTPRLEMRAALCLQPFKYSRTTRCFHATSISAARPSSRMSPSVKKQSRPQQGTIRTIKPPTIEDSLPPIVLLNSARKSGVLPIEPERALDFLRAYQKGSRSGKSEQGLCDEYGIEPTTLALLGGILRRCQTNPQQLLAKRVMHSASALGDKSATLDLVHSALNTKSLHEHPALFRRLTDLADKQDDPQAWSLLGVMYSKQKRNKLALDCFRKATTTETGKLDFPGAGDTLFYLGSLLAEIGEKDGARAALEKAALELDQPESYFALSALQDRKSPLYQEYLSKAASSGIVQAWNTLGMLELESFTASQRELSKVEDFGMAYEWFHVAATQGSPQAMVALGQIYEGLGMTDESQEWMIKAKEAQAASRKAA